MKNISATFKGVITGLLMVVAALCLFYVVKLPVTGKTQFILIAIYLCGIMWSLFSFHKFSNNTPEERKFKQYFSEGFRTFIVVTLIMVVFTYIFYKLNPQILEGVIKENNELIVKGGNKMPAEIADNEKKLRDIFIPGMLMWSIVEYLFLGALVTLIGAGFLSQKKN